MESNQLHKKKTTAPVTDEHPETAGKLPVLTPDGKKEKRDVQEEEVEAPYADEQPLTPKQPLYEDKTETYYRKKQQPKR
jgi:hypothetical protein